MRHRTERNRVGLLARGLCGALVACGLTLTMLPNAASGPRVAVNDATNVQTPGDRSAGRRAATHGDDAPKGVWARPGRIDVPVGRLTIPAIDLDAPLRMGVHDRIVALGPGLWPGTPLPGDRGNAVLAGHRTTHTHPFENLDLLRRGDVVITKLHGRPRTFFRVGQISIVPESDYADFVLEQPAARARQITLFACTPKGYRSHRIVVRAKARASSSTTASSDAMPAVRSSGRS